MSGVKMGVRTLLIILASIMLSATAQIVLKAGMNSQSGRVALDVDGWLRFGLSTLINPIVIAGLLLYGLGAILWLIVLARLDVTQAYPFVGLGFIFTMVLGYLILAEPVGLQRVLGTLLITTGVILVARS